MIFLTLIAVFSLVVIWETLCRRMGPQWIGYTPTYFLAVIEQESRRFWRTLGHLWANISSFLIWLQVADLFHNACNILVACWRILLSIKDFSAGYWRAIRTHQWTWWQVYAGSVLLIVAFLVGIVYLVIGFGWMLDLWNLISERAFSEKILDKMLTFLALLAFAAFFHVLGFRFD